MKLFYVFAFMSPPQVTPMKRVPLLSDFPFFLLAHTKTAGIGMFLVVGLNEEKYSGIRGVDFFCFLFCLVVNHRGTTLVIVSFFRPFVAVQLSTTSLSIYTPAV